MKESKFRAEMHRLLRRLWYYPITSPNTRRCSSCGAAIKPRVVGRPDILCFSPAEPGVAVEVKMFVHSPDKPWNNADFPFAKITDEQRLWLSNFQEDGDERRAFLDLTPWTASYLAICTSHGRAGSKHEPRLAWLPPWSKWLELESRVLKVRKSLPLVALRKSDAGLGATELLEPWALIWEKGGWAVKIDHPLWVPELRDLKEFSAKWTKGDKS